MSPDSRPRRAYSGRRPAARWAAPLVAAATVALTPGAGATAAEPLGWEPCGEGFDCAALTVPMDEAEPGGCDGWTSRPWRPMS